MQWFSSLIKIWVQMNLAQQKWANRGNQSIDIGGGILKRFLKRSASQFMIVVQVLTFVMSILMLVGQFQPWEDFAVRQFYQQVSKEKLDFPLNQVKK
jgi:glycosyltransferase Alg8